MAAAAPTTPEDIPPELHSELWSRPREGRLVPRGRCRRSRKAFFTAGRSLQGIGESRRVMAIGQFWRAAANRGGGGGRRRSAHRPKFRTGRELVGAAAPRSCSPETKKRKGGKREVHGDELPSLLVAHELGDEQDEEEHEEINREERRWR